MKLSVNGKDIEIEADPAMPLLWALRDLAGIKGPKFGCGIAMCGACTVLVDGEPRRSCSLKVGEVEGDITTIEGLTEGDSLHSVQQAWIAEQVPQCGYCQSGQVVSATALLKEIPKPSDEDIDRAMAGNICRCGTYGRIRKAIKRAAGAVQSWEPATGEVDA